VSGWARDASRALVLDPASDGRPAALAVVDAETGAVAARFPVDAPSLRGAGLDATGATAWWLAGREWRVVDVATGRPLRSSRLVDEPPEAASVFPSPDGRFVAISFPDHLGVYEQASGALAGRMARGLQPLRPTWAADSVHVVVAHPPMARSALYRHDGDQPLRTFLGHTGFVTDAEGDPTGRLVFSVAVDKTVRAFDAATGRLLGAYRGLPLQGASLTVDPAGRRIAVASAKHVLLDVGEDGSLREFAVLERDGLEALWFHPDGRRIVLVDEEQRARTLDLDPVAAGRAALRRPVLRVDGVQDYAPDPAEPLDAAWLGRNDPVWSLERARRALLAGDLDDAERALDRASAARPRWAAPDLERARLAAARATARGAAAAEAVPEIVRALEAARAKGHPWHLARTLRDPPPELAPYLGDARLAALVRELTAEED
jgi:hypothetical protein